MYMITLHQIMFAFAENGPQRALAGSCSELLKENKERKNGLYNITIEGVPNPVTVYCDMETPSPHGKGWTVVILVLLGLRDLDFILYTAEVMTV